MICLLRHIFKESTQTVGTKTLAPLEKKGASELLRPAHLKRYPDLGQRVEGLETGTGTTKEKLWQGQGQGPEGLIPKK